MLTEKTWEEFRSTGLTLIINQILHIFGWAITYEVDDGKIIRAFPARCKFRGFSGKCVDESYQNVSRWMVEHSEELLKEALED